MHGGPRLLGHLHFKPWRQVVPTQLHLVRPPKGRVGVYEWGCKAPGGSRIVVFYLGKAGASESSANLSVLERTACEMITI